MDFKLVFVLCICILSAWKTEAALCSNNANFGDINNNWWNYNGQEGFTGYGYLMLDVNYVVDCCGVVTDWRVLVNHVADQVVYFQVWRPITGTSSYKLLGQTSYTVTTTDWITASLPQSQRITVKAGDAFGWWTAGSSDVIRYDPGGGEANNNYMQSMSSLAVGATQNWGSATIRNGRTYPLRMSVDANNKPSFSNLNAAVSLSTSNPIATSVFTVSATDIDNDDISTLALSMAPSSKYSFDTSSGIITTTTSLAPYGATTDQLVFKVSDQCGNTATGTLTVRIINQPPVIHNLPGTTYVSEDVMAETLLYTLNATDPDGSPVTCSLPGAVSANYQFVVHQIPSSTAYGIYSKFNPGFAYNTTSSYPVNIGCTDGIDTVTGTLTVYLIQNPPPVFINLQNATVISTTYAVGAIMFSVLVNDTDDLKFTMTCDTSPCPFTIFDSGAILVSSDLTSHTIVGYDLQIWVNDGRTTTGPKTLTVTIADINDPVVITNLPSSVSVAENTGVGTTLFHVSYSDKDMGQLHTVSMTSSPTEGSKYFAINSGGDITISSMINYEAITAKTFSLAVTVTDPVTSDTKALTVLVTNVNEPPTFSQSSYTLSAKEGSAGVVLGTPAFGLSDPDSGDTKTLSLNCGNMTGYFSINSNTGQIMYQSDYDIDTGSLATSVPCVVTVTDGGGLTDTANLLIKIANANDNVPVFSPVSYSFYVNYYAIAGTSVGVVTATDLDISPFGTLTYTLDQSSLSVEYFAINNKGEITVKTSPNGAVMGYATSVTLTAIASDVGGQSDTATVLIFISDTTTTTTTTTTDRYRTFFEDNKNIAWFSASIAVLLVAMVAVFYVVYTCHGPNGCAQFKRTVCNKRKIFKRPQPSRRYSFENTMNENPTRIVPVVRQPPPPKGFQFWRAQV